MKFPKPLAIDTQLLVLLVVGLADLTYIDRHKRVTPQYKLKHFEIVRVLLESAPQVVVTAHVLAEASNLLRQCADPMRSTIQSTFREIIKRAEECAVSARSAILQPTFIRLGLTDAAILSLDPNEIALLTVDHNLHVAASQNGFEVFNLSSTLYE